MDNEMIGVAVEFENGEIVHGYGENSEAALQEAMDLAKLEGITGRKVDAWLLW